MNDASTMATISLVLHVTFDHLAVLQDHLVQLESTPFAEAAAIGAVSELGLVATVQITFGVAALAPRTHANGFRSFT